MPSGFDPLRCTPTPSAAIRAEKGDPDHISFFEF